MKTFRHRHQGFTLIELVVVITILGILAAFAIPRFASLETEARIGVIQGLAGGVRSSAALAHSLWLTQNAPATVIFEGTVVNMTNGYPVAADIDDTLADYTGFDFSSAGGSATFTRPAAPTPANCSVTYSNAVVGSSPVIAVDVTGC
ncbi:MAG: prepilin-type N-terminal cleavage/methylation domain-containing protein [Gammaproteobacteria bacterium]|nr:prepilin-type N-terminal cleavage/methylation domain-containing protein [Gammaproteobacteria bacterium]